MTTGVPAGDGGYADAPTAPTAPLAWGAGGPGQHAPTQPLPGIPHTPTSPGMPRAGRPPGPRGGRATAAAAAPAAPVAAPRPDRVLALALAGVLAFATLLLVTPSVSTAPSLAQAFDRAHGAAYPGPPVPSRFAASLVATEDHRFYSEPGFDPIAIGRVIAGRVTGQPDQGGATLYQQLAKMLYTPGQAGVNVEVEQIILGIKLDLSYSKAQILRLYADVAYFGHGYYGLARGELRLLRRDAGRAELAAGGAAGGPGAGAHRRQPDRALQPWPGRGRRTCSAGWSPPGSSPRPRRPGPTARRCTSSAARPGAAPPADASSDALRGPAMPGHPRDTGIRG